MNKIVDVLASFSFKILLGIIISLLLGYVLPLPETYYEYILLVLFIIIIASLLYIILFSDIFGKVKKKYLYNIECFFKKYIQSDGNTRKEVSSSLSEKVENRNTLPIQAYCRTIENVGIQLARKDYAEIYDEIIQRIDNIDSGITKNIVFFVEPKSLNSNHIQYYSKYDHVARLGNHTMEIWFHYYIKPKDEFPWIKEYIDTMKQLSADDKIRLEPVVHIWNSKFKFPSDFTSKFSEFRTSDCKFYFEVLYDNNIIARRKQSDAERELKNE